jgi:hypothetical protein
MALLTAQASSSKLAKNSGIDDTYMSFIMYLAPADIVDGINVCPASTAGCRKACLFTAGRGKFSNVQAARVRRTTQWRDDPDGFIEQLVVEVDKAIRRARRAGKKPAFRFNGTSDVDWETEIRDRHPYFYEEREDAVFYEYTKRPELALRKSPIKFTFSRSDTNHNLLGRMLGKVNVAMVFSKLPDIYMGVRVIKGDKHDLRWTDPKGVIVGLLPKGEAKKDSSGFVIHIPSSIE